MKKIMINLNPLDRKEILEILQLIFVRGETVKAFGSRVKGTHYDGSDLDLVVMAEHDLSKEISKAKRLFHDSNIPIFVQIHEWNKLPDSFKANIETHSVIFFGDE